MEKYNPLESWRGKNSLAWGAFRLYMPEEDYTILESHPERSNIKSDQIIKIARITNIPLEVLVDYLTETTKEVV